MKEDPSSFPFFNLTGLSSSSLAPWNCLSCPESDTYLPIDTSALQWAIEERVEGSHYPPQEDHTFISTSFLLSQFLMFLCRLPAFTHILALFCPPEASSYLYFPLFLHFSLPLRSLYYPTQLSIILPADLIFSFPLCCQGFCPLSFLSSFPRSFNLSN